MRVSNLTSFDATEGRLGNCRLRVLTPPLSAGRLPLAGRGWNDVGFLGRKNRGARLAPIWTIDLDWSVSLQNHVRDTHALLSVSLDERVGHGEKELDMVRESGYMHWKIETLRNGRR